MKKIKSINEVAGFNVKVDKCILDIFKKFDGIDKVKKFIAIDNYNQTITECLVLYINENYEIIFSLDGTFNKLEIELKRCFSNSKFKLFYIVKNKKL